MMSNHIPVSAPTNGSIIAMSLVGVTKSIEPESAAVNVRVLSSLPEPRVNTLRLYPNPVQVEKEAEVPAEVGPVESTCDGVVRDNIIHPEFS